MKILGIETSCDETAAAVVENGTKILSSVVTSSESLHQRFGGIIPEQAAREQIKCIVPVIDQALAVANLPGVKSKNSITNHQSLIINHIDAIAVTYGPGLIGSLLVGVETAKALSFALGKPLIPVNHLLGHVYANFLSRKSSAITGHAELGWASEKNGNRIPKQVRDDEKINLPAVCLIVSGGHTDLLLMKAKGRNPRSLTESQGIGMKKNHTFQWLGGTRDDAAGECFDKTARLLGLGYPGGPAIEKAASLLKANSYKLEAQIKLPRPMMHEDNFDFSFSGLKTAVLALTKQAGLGSDSKQNRSKRVRPFSKQFVNSMAYEIQEAITDVLVTKTLRATEEHKVKSILIGGGVAANARLREKFRSVISHQSSVIRLFVPPKSLCTDNAAVIAATAFYQNRPVNWRNLKPNPSLHF